MLPKQLLEQFKKDFPWFADKVVKYKGNRKEGGVDIFLEDGTVLNYRKEKNDWLLKRGDISDLPT